MSKIPKIPVQIERTRARGKRNHKFCAYATWSLKPEFQRYETNKKLNEKLINWWNGEMWFGHFLNYFLQNCYVNKLRFHWSPHQQWFLLILKQDFFPTLMHTPVLCGPKQLLFNESTAPISYPKALRQAPASTFIISMSSVGKLCGNN